MNKITWMLLGIIVIAGVVLLAMNKKDNIENSNDAVTFATIQEEVESGNASLYDVRTADEYASGHFAGAKLHDVQDIQQGIYPDEEKDRKIYVYCRSGNRSAQATHALQEAGFTNIVDLGGVSDVQSMGGTLIE